MGATVLQLADMHLRADGRDVYGGDPQRRLDLVLEACRRELAAVDLVLATGDQSDDGQPAALAQVRRMLAEIDAPVLAVPGNHDDAEAQRECFGDWRPVELADWRVAGLDSSIPGEVHGSIDPRAVAALLDTLDTRPTLLTMHHPPVAPTTHPWFQLEHAASLLAVLAARPHVRAVVSGHAHYSFSLACDGLQLLGGPSTLAPFRFDGAELTAGAGGPAGARAIFLADDGSLHSQVIEA